MPALVVEAAEQAVADGYFVSIDELVRVAVQQLIQGERLREIETAQLEDLQAAFRAAS